MSNASSAARRFNPLAALAAQVARLAGRAAHAFASRRGSAAELRELTNAQLHDIGVDRATIEPSRPTLEVDGAVMRRLMSLS